MTTLSDKSKKTGLKSWTTRDLLVTAVIAIVFGLLSIGLNYLFALLTAVNPMLVSVLSGIYYTPMIMAMFIIRRPGAIVLAALIGHLVMIAFNPFGWMESIFSVFIALFYELPFLVTRYRDFRLRILLISGGLAGFISFVSMFAFGSLSALTPLSQIMTMVLFVFSGMILGGWLAKLLSAFLVKTGVLDGFAISLEQREEI